MEAPAALVFAGLFALGSQKGSVVAWTFLAMWETHYIYRAFIYPFTLREEDRPMPFTIAAMGIVFNSVNASLNALWLFHGPGRADGSWLADPRFLAGAALFATGLVVNRQADATLRALRPAGENGYRVPHGGLYRWVSCPNYLGEIVQWTGWALATWSLPGLGFAVWTAANLIPRARTNHRWYIDSFPDYPEDRRALVPGLW